MKTSLSVCLIAFALKVPAAFTQSPVIPKLADLPAGKGWKATDLDYPSGGTPRPISM